MKKIALLLIILSYSCASTQTINKDKSTILTLVGIQMLENLDKYFDQDTAYVARESVNSYFSNVIFDVDFKKRVNVYFDYDSIFEIGDMEHLRQQLKSDDYLDFENFNSDRIKVFSKDNYQNKFSLSDPVFTKNKKWGFVLVMRREVGISISIFKNKDGKWGFYKFLPLGIV